MNKKRILELADTIDGLPTVVYGTNDPNSHSFCMEATNHPCGSPACLAGWTDELWNPDKYPDPLGIAGTGREMELFEPREPWATYFHRPHQDGFITSEHAAAVLRNLAETGEVDWTVGAGI